MSTKEKERNTQYHKSSREQKRLQRLEKLRQYGVDLPDIPGLPVEVIPLHVHVMKMTAKLFGKHGPYQTKVLYLQDDESNRATNEGRQMAPTIASLLTNTMQRVEDAADHNNSQSTETEEQRRMESDILQKYQDGIQTWLNAIHRSVKDNRSRQTRESTEEETVVSAYSIPLAALQHLWSVGMDHKRFSVRRATQHLAGKLLEQSSDCRSWWLQLSSDETSFREHASNGKRQHKISVVVWMDNVLQSQTESEAQKLWQLEAFDRLKHLERKGYGDLYPTLISAIQRFQQKCPVSTLESVDTENEGTSSQTTSMAKFRFVRDTAMAHWDEMDTRLQKLIQKAKWCFGVLVPRMEDTVSGEASGTAEEGEEEEDIDWEDGFEDDGTDLSSAVNESIHHANAVERTLEIMKNTGGMQEGRLEISIFSKEEKTNDPQSSNTNAEVNPHYTQSKQTLDRVINILSTNYRLRLSDWAQALAAADNLKVKRSGKRATEDDPNSDPLIQMTDSEQIRRSEVLQSCLDVKQEVAHILQSAKRLGVDLVETRSSNVQEDRLPATLPPTTLRNSGVPARFAGRKRALGSRSTPLQIKFAKR